jgi:hypothetical protein
MKQEIYIGASGPIMPNSDPMPIDFDAARKLIDDVLSDRLVPGRHKAELVCSYIVMTDGPPNIVHLGADGTTCGVCSIEADEDHVSSEHNDITCPFCHAIHEATCLSGDGESEYFGWDIDSIMATESFLDECLRTLAHRLSFRGGDAP